MEPGNGEVEPAGAGNEKSRLLGDGGLMGENGISPESLKFALVAIWGTDCILFRNKRQA